MTLHLVTDFTPARDPRTETCDCHLAADHDTEGNLHD